VTRLVIKQHRSSIGEKIAARRTLEALGLRRTGQTVEQTDSQAVRGMLRRVAHLVEVSDSQQTASSETSGKSANTGPAAVSKESAT
jgi:large subunit ribosomal protein L30